VYYKCVKFHKNPISGLGGVALPRYIDGRMDKVNEKEGGGMYLVSATPAKLLIEFL
jgi:hypothetical protein